MVNLKLMNCASLGFTIELLLDHGCLQVTEIMGSKTVAKGGLLYIFSEGKTVLLKLLSLM